MIVRKGRWLLLVMLLLACAGCAREQAAIPPGRVVIRVWSGWTGQEQDHFEKALADFNRSQSRVWAVNMSTVEDDGGVMRALTAGTPPDAFFLWEPAYLGALAANRAILPLDDFIRESDLKVSDLTPGALGQLEYRGHIYAMPFLIDTMALYWNKAVFREVGLDPERPPRTLSELERYIRLLTKRDKHGRLQRVGFEMPSLASFIALFGGPLYDQRTGRIVLTDPRSLEAARFYKHLYDLQGGGQRLEAFSQGFGAFDSNQNHFLVGKTAMMFGGEWWCEVARRFGPHVDFGVAPLPYPDQHPEQAGTTFLGGNPCCIARASKHPREAFALLRWMQTYRAQEKFASEMFNCPNYRPVLNSPLLTTGSRWKVAFGKVCRTADSPRARWFPATPVNLLYARELDTAAQYLARGTKTPERALREVEQRVQAELDRFHGRRTVR